MSTRMTCTSHCLSKSPGQESLFQCFPPRIQMILDLVSHCGARGCLTPFLPTPPHPFPGSKWKTSWVNPDWRRSPIVAAKTGGLLGSPRAGAQVWPPYLGEVPSVLRFCHPPSCKGHIQLVLSRFVISFPSPGATPGCLGVNVKLSGELFPQGISQSWSWTLPTVYPAPLIHIHPH